jgi:hypothetical protein
MGMGPFPLPTDNLYKFCALVGVVVIGLCLYRSFNLKHEYAIREIELGAATQRADLEKTALQTLIDKVGAELKEGEASVEAGTTPAQRDSEALKNKHREAERLVREYTLRNIEVISLAKQLTLIVKDRIELLFEAFIALIAGGVLSVYGFAKWWKLQQQQDRLLAAAVEKECGQKGESGRRDAE